jgi:hypothetical protein
VIGMDGGIFDLGSRAITAALTDTVITEATGQAGNSQAYVDRLAGMTAISLVAAFTYGSGGTTAIVTVETAFANGVWYPIARLDFAQTTATKFITLSGLTPRLSPLTNATLGAEGAVDGILGDRLRAKVTSTGTYGASTMLSVLASVR